MATHNSREQGGDRVGYSEVVSQENIMKHYILNMLRSYRSKFKSKYGNLVICCDDVDYWRLAKFPYYKAKRNEHRDSQGIDFDLIYKVMKEMIEDLHVWFPYKVIKVWHCEADDVIGTLVKAANGQEPIMIVSGDKDFPQLQKFGQVKQYSPTKKIFLETDDPVSFLKEHIIRGDKDDGIPNVLSDGDTLVVKEKRQPPMTDKRIELIQDVVWADIPEDDMDKNVIETKTMNITFRELQSNILRNRELIDLNMIPIDMQEAIISAYRNYDGCVERHKMFNYFIKNRLSKMMERLQEF